MIVVIIIVMKTVSKGLENAFEQSEKGGRIDTIQTTLLMRSARILRKVRET